MEQSLLNAISTVGFPIVGCCLLGYGIYKVVLNIIKNQEERINKQDDRIKLQDRRIDKMEERHDKDRDEFKRAIDILGVSVAEFTKMNSKIDTLEDKVDDIANIVKR